MRSLPGEASSRAARRGPPEVAQEEGPASAEAKLVCIGGNQLGSEYILTGEEVVVGRSPDNAVSIPDNSVSRKHLLLRQTPEGWMASDMGSGNGTLVNGELISEETLLSNGDQLAVGDTEFEFVCEGGPERRLARAGSGAALESRRSERQSLRARRREQEAAQKKPKSRKLLFVLLALGLSMVGAGVYLKIEQGKRDPETIKREWEAAQRAQTLNERFQTIRGLIREGNWLDAQQALQELQEQAPDFDKSREVANLLKAAEQEVPNQMAMDAAQGALELEVPELREAHVRLAQVANTEYQRERLTTLQRKLREAISKKIAMGQALSSQTSSREKMVELKTLMDDVLGASPGQRDATSYQSIAVEAIRNLDRPTPKFVPPETPWVAVTERYKAGEVEEATQLAGACADKHARCKTMHTQLTDVAKKNQRIEMLTPKEFFEFYDLDKKLSEGAGSTLTKRILLFAVPAVESNARNAKLAGRLGEATTLSSGLLKMDSKNATARGIMDEVRTQAEETYLRAYTMRSTQPDQAERLFNQVLQMLPASEEIAQKAQTQLRALRRGKLADEE